ncbi:MAG: methyltransferase [Bacteroidales bacterium]|nr:methyltransferase [Bacteroidales bacterium]
MSECQYIYTFKYNQHYRQLCKLETRQIFGAEVNNNLLFSGLKIDPSISPFIRERFEIISSSSDYKLLLINIEKENIQSEGFKAEYLILDGDETGYKERLNKLRDIGYRIEGIPDYNDPIIIYSICKFDNIWYFGILKKHNIGWHNHKQKPHSFSNSLGMVIAKALVSIASKGDESKLLLDACCGVGTVMLEACFSGFNIDGCDINWRAVKHTRENLAHYGYSAIVYRSDIKDLDKKYDAVIIDLPYNIYTYSDDKISQNIIDSSANKSKRIIIVSVSDIQIMIQNAGLKTIDFCKVAKRGKSNFERMVWICE